METERGARALFGAACAAVALATVLACGTAALAKGSKGGKGGPPAPGPAKAATGLRVTITDASGKLARGARAAILRAAGSDASGAWLRSNLEQAEADRDGVAQFTMSSDPFCLLAWKDGDCAFVCNEKGPADARYSVRLAPGEVVAGTLLLSSGKPAPNPVLRLRFAGGYEWHHLDVAVAADGSFRLPPLPAGILDREDAAYFEAKADGVPEQKLGLGPDRSAQRLVVAGPRHVIGKLVGADKKAVTGATVRSGDGIQGPEAAADVQGSFDLAGAPSDLGDHVWILSTSHAPQRVALPDGSADADLGTIRLDPGSRLRGTVKASDGRKVERAFVTVSAGDGFRVASTDTEPGDAFEFAHLGSEPYRVQVYVHRLKDAASWLTRTGTFQAGGDDVEIVVGTGVVLRLVNEKGAAVFAGDVRVELEAPEWPKVRTEQFQAMPRQPKFSEIRISAFGAGTVRAKVHVEGKGPFVAEGIVVDEAGNGAGDVIVR